jgi:hypothetical protein
VLCSRFFDLQVTNSDGVCAFPGLDTVGAQLLPLATPLLVLVPWVVIVAIAWACAGRCGSCCAEQSGERSALVESAASAGHRRKPAREVRDPTSSLFGDSGTVEKQKEAARDSIHDLNRTAEQSQRQGRVWVRSAHVLVNVALYTYSTLIKSVFALVTCVPVNGLSGTYLFTSASTECYAGWQVPILIVAIVLAAFPPLLFVWTWRLDYKGVNSPVEDGSVRAVVVEVCLHSLFSSCLCWLTTAT